MYTSVYCLAFVSLKSVTHTLRAVNAWATERLHCPDNNTYRKYSLAPNYSLREECVVLSFYVSVILCPIYHLRELIHVFKNSQHTLSKH